jgi:hypothetical protein
MNCNEFLDRYSEYHDDDGTLSDRGRFADHLEDCSSCRSYRDVIVRGTGLLRDQPPPTFREDFRDRLQHRLYLSELQGLRPPRASGVPPAISLGLAAAAMLAVAAAWGPMVEAVVPMPVTSLPAISATAPDFARARDVPAAGGSRAPAALLQPDYWVQSHSLLYEHSSLYHRNRQGSLFRAGIQ